MKTVIDVKWTTFIYLAIASRVWNSSGQPYKSIYSNPHLAIHRSVYRAIKDEWQIVMPVLIMSVLNGLENNANTTYIALIQAASTLFITKSFI